MKITIIDNDGLNLKILHFQGSIRTGVCFPVVAVDNGIRLCE